MVRILALSEKWFEIFKNIYSHSLNFYKLSLNYIKIPLINCLVNIIYNFDPQLSYNVREVLPCGKIPFISPKSGSQANEKFLFVSANL